MITKTQTSCLMKAKSASSLFPSSCNSLSYLKLCQPQKWTGCHSIHQRRPQRHGRSDRSRLPSHCRIPQSCPRSLWSDHYCPALWQCRSRLLGSQTRTQSENWPHSPLQRRCSQGCTALRTGDEEGMMLG